MGIGRKSILAAGVAAVLASSGAAAQQEVPSQQELEAQARQMMSGQSESESGNGKSATSRYFEGAGQAESGKEAPGSEKSPAGQKRSGERSKESISGVRYGPDGASDSGGDFGTSKLDVAVGEFNLFKFPSSIKEAILPNDAPVSGKPRYVDANKGLLLKFDANDETAFQIVVTLQDGSTEMISVTPREDIIAQTHKVGDFTTTRNRTGLSEQNNPNADYLPVMAEKLRRLASVPDGFFKTKMMPPKRQYKGRDKQGQPVGVALDPVERLEGKVEGRKVYLDLYHIKTTEGVSHDNIDPSQFWERGVGAATITRDAANQYFALIMREAE